MSELSVSGGGRFDPSYSTSADIPGSVYGSSTSGHHSVPPSASYSTSSISGPEYRQSAAGRNGSSNISGSVMTTTAAGRGSSEEDQLREQVRQLRQQLSEKQATIAELQQPVYAGASRGAAHHTSPDTPPCWATPASSRPPGIADRSLITPRTVDQCKCR